MTASTFVENKQVSGLSLFCEKAKWLTILPNPTPYNILKPPPKPRQAFSLTKHPEQIHVSRGSGGASGQFILSKPADSSNSNTFSSNAANNIKNIRNEQASIILYSTDFFIGWFWGFFNGWKTNKDSAPNQKTNKSQIQ